MVFDGVTGKRKTGAPLLVCRKNWSESKVRVQKPWILGREALAENARELKRSPGQDEPQGLVLPVRFAFFEKGSEALFEIRSAADAGIFQNGALEIMVKAGGGSGSEQ